MDDCKYTDKFSVSRLESCANVCYSEKDCEYYVFGKEDGISKCWLRRSVGADGVGHPQSVEE